MMATRVLLSMLLILGLALAFGCGKKPEPETDLTQTEQELADAEAAAQRAAEEEAAGEMGRFDDLFGRSGEQEEVVEEVPPPPPPIITLEDVHFEFDKFTLTAEARRILAQTAKALKDNAELRVQIEGHCDDRGTQEYNLALGQRRAQAAKDYLVNFGIDPARVTIISYGEERPLDPRSSEDAWAKNRRAHFNKR